MDILLPVAALFVFLAAAGWFYQWFGTARDRRRFPMPGRLVDIGGRRLHLLGTGDGRPAVILEAGIAASSLNWTSIQASLAPFTSVFSYDRAWLGWSDPADSPRIISQVVAELHAPLTAVQIPAPFVLTGHSFGGLVVRCYAARYPARVAGLVLVDPLAVGEWLEPSGAQRKTLRRAARLARRGALLARFGVVRFGLAMLAGGARLIPRLVAKLASRGSGESAISRLVREVQKMPPETWPIVQAHWCQPKSFLGMADYLESLPASSAEAAAMGELPAHIPVTIFSASNSGAMQIAERDAITRRSMGGKHVVAAKSGHWIHFDEPEQVIRAIRECLPHSSNT
jgi:pimeloyl-ACP methyl ester carboxylesterase